MRTAVRCIALIASAIGVHAQDCNAPFASSDPGVTLSVKLQSALGELVNAGADVRVRAVSRMGTATLDEYERSIERSCASWRAPDGGRKNNLVVLMVAVRDRKSGIYYGAQWPALQSQWPHIQSTIMAPRFRDGDFAGGLAAALGEIRTVITTRVSAAAVIVQPSAPTDFSGLWTVMLWSVVIGGGGVLGWLVLSWWSARRKEREERLGAQQAALIAQQEASGLVAQYCSWPENAEAQAIIDSAVQGYSQLGMGAVDPAREDLTASQYEAIRERYAAVSADLKRAYRLTRAERKDTVPASTDGADEILRRRHDRLGSRPQRDVVEYRPVSVVPIYIPGGNVMPVFIPEPVSYDTPSYRRDPDPAPSPSSESSGGGSSSWGSSSDSGGGSSDSGSSDCGSGGGSSDW